MTDSKNPQPPDLTNLGAAIFGMYAAIKICLHNDIDPHGAITQRIASM